MSSVRSSSTPRQAHPAEYPDRTTDRAAYQTSGRAPRRWSPAGSWFDFVEIFDQEVAARADDAADQRREDDLLGPVDRAAELAQAPCDEAPPQARKPSANITPKVLIEIPRSWISGFMACGAAGIDLSLASLPGVLFLYMLREHTELRLPLNSFPSWP